MKNDKKKILEEIDKVLGEDKSQEIFAFLKNHRKEVVEAYKEILQKQGIAEGKIDDLITIFALKLNSLEGLLGIIANKELFKVEVVNQVIPPNEVSVKNLAEINIPSEIKVSKPNWLSEFITIINTALLPIFDFFRKRFEIIEGHINPKNPIAVRLSDGQKFIDRLTEAIQSYNPVGLDKEATDLLKSIVDNTEHIELNADTINLDTDQLETLIGETNDWLESIKTNGDDLKIYTDGIETLLTAGNNWLNSIKTNTDDLKTYTDQLETLITSTNSWLNSIKINTDDIKTYVDGIETALINLQTYTDNLEGLVTSTNSKLDDLITYTDGIEGLLTDIKTNTNNISNKTATSWQYFCDNNKGYSLVKENGEPANATETDWILIKNPSISGHNLRIKRFLAIMGKVNLGAIWRVYKNPTITTNGTILTPRNKRELTEATVMEAYFQPTISARGTLLQAFGVTTGTVFEDEDLALTFIPAKTFLLTLEPSLKSNPYGIVIEWAEEEV